MQSAMPEHSKSLSPRDVRDPYDMIAALKKENFSLKLRIYFLEERCVPPNRLAKENDQLKDEIQTLIIQLQDKQNLLCQAAKAIELIEETQIEQKNAYDSQIQALEKMKSLLEAKTKEARALQDQAVRYQQQTVRYQEQTARYQHQLREMQLQQDELQTALQRKTLLDKELQVDFMEGGDHSPVQQVKSFELMELKILRGLLAEHKIVINKHEAGQRAACQVIQGCLVVNKAQARELEGLRKCLLEYKRTPTVDASTSCTTRKHRHSVKAVAQNAKSSRHAIPQICWSLFNDKAKSDPVYNIK